jgi:hypothetical protein
MHTHELHTLHIYRNCAFEYPMVIEQASGSQEDVYGWQFALVIAATNPSRVFGPPVITNTTPYIASGTSNVTFILSDTDTANLVIGTAYEFRALVIVPGSEQAVLREGRVKVTDAPVFP